MRSRLELRTMALWAGWVAAVCLTGSCASGDESPSGSGSGGSAGSAGLAPAGAAGQAADGTGGSDSCSLANRSDPVQCELCIIDFCCDEFDDCRDDCKQEFECMQERLVQIYQAEGVTTRAQQADALNECREDGDDVTREMGALFDCLVDIERCAVSCLGGYEPAGTGGGGGPGGAGGEPSGGAGGEPSGGGAGETAGGASGAPTEAGAGGAAGGD